MIYSNALRRAGTAVALGAGFLAVPAMAAPQVNTVAHVHGPYCGHWDGMSVAEQAAYLGDTGASQSHIAPSTFLTNFRRSLANDGMGGSAPAIPGSGGPAGDPVTVYLDFDSTPDTFQVGLERLDGSTGLFGLDTDNDGVADDFDFDAFQYSQAQRDAIQAGFEKDYAAFNFQFVQEPPAEGDFTTVTFGDTTIGGDPNITVLEIDSDNDGSVDGFSFSILFGQADAIDFGDINRNDTGRVDGNFWTFLDQANFNLSAFNGATATPEDVAAAVVQQSLNTGSHELGHNLGLRHHDSLGPIGTGTSGAGNTATDAFGGSWPTPAAADETFDHLMASGASVGLPLSNSINSDRFLSERSATKLAFTYNGTFLAEDNLETTALGQPLNLEIPSGSDTLAFGFPLPSTNETFTEIKVLELESLLVPITLESGDNLNRPSVQTGDGAFFDVVATSVLGLIDDSSVGDLFQLNTDGADRWYSFELLSSTSGFIDAFIGDILFNQLTIYDENFEVLDWFDGVATALFDGEAAFDKLVWDLFLPADSTFYIAVSTPDELGLTANLTGFYELFITGFAVPLPAPVLLLLSGLVGLMVARRRKLPAAA